MPVGNLLADLKARGVKLVAHGDRLRYYPRSAVTPDLLERIKIHKVELLALVRPGAATSASDAGARTEREAPRWPAQPSSAECRCGSRKTVDVLIHGGQSVRRDCACCGRFIAFMVWYGRLSQPSKN